MPRRDLVRLVVVPMLLFAGVSGLVFTLAELHPAKPDTTAASGTVALGSADEGAVVFRETCAGCHGPAGGGGIGPRLAGATLSLAEVKAQIDNGGGTMPARLVTGLREADVLAYVAELLEPSSR
jgi:mono/diheme cytochrome c family protein